MSAPTIAVTGGRGFLGWHTGCRLIAEGAQVRLLGRGEIDAAGSLDGCAAVIHCAGVNRGDDRAVHDGNVDAATALVESLRRAATPPARVVYASSTQAGSTTPYGESKRLAGEVLARGCEELGVEYHEAVIPNVFGEGGQPFYNSFVATFCHQIARGEPCTVIEDRAVTLVHAQQVARILVAAALHGTPIPSPFPGTSTTVRSVLDRLLEIDRSYASNVFPDIDDPFGADLFNTLRSAIFSLRGPVVPLTRNSDPRGWLVETAKQVGGGQTFVSSTVPGITRGRHFHLRKVERFVVLQGTGTIEMRRLFSGDVARYEVSGEAPVAVEIPTLHTHAITNTGSAPLITLFWSNELFDPANPDTYALAIEEGPDR